MFRLDANTSCTTEIVKLDSLRQHVATVHLSDKLVKLHNLDPTQRACPICGYGVSKMAQLKKHLAFKHYELLTEKYPFFMRNRFPEGWMKEISGVCDRPDVFVRMNREKSATDILLSKMALLKAPQNVQKVERPPPSLVSNKEPLCLELHEDGTYEFKPIPDYKPKKVVQRILQVKEPSDEEMRKVLKEHNLGFLLDSL